MHAMEVAESVPFHVVCAQCRQRGNLLIEVLTRLDCEHGTCAQVRLEKSALFHVARAAQALDALHVRGMPAGLSGQERARLLNTMISLAATQQARLWSARPICACLSWVHGPHKPADIPQAGRARPCNEESAAACACMRPCMSAVQVCAAGALLAILHREGLLRRVHASPGAQAGSASDLVCPLHILHVPSSCSLVMACMQGSAHRRIHSMHTACRQLPFMQLCAFRRRLQRTGTPPWRVRTMTRLQERSCWRWRRCERCRWTAT